MLLYNCIYMRGFYCLHTLGATTGMSNKGRALMRPSHNETIQGNGKKYIFSEYNEHTWFNRDLSLIGKWITKDSGVTGGEGGQ